MVRILHDGWSIRLGENRPDQLLKHLVAMLCCNRFTMESHVEKVDSIFVVAILPGYHFYETNDPMC